MSRGENGEPYVLHCLLPGIKSYLGMHASIEDARKKAESVFKHWLNITGLQEVDPGMVVIK
jgi:hypothetical protein